MARTTTKVLAGVAVAALAAAAVAAVVKYRRGQHLEPDEHALLDELDTRLKEADEPGSHTAPAGIGRVLEKLRRNRDVSVGRLRSWIAGVRRGSLSPAQAIVAESDFEVFEREADQGGV